MLGKELSRWLGQDESFASQAFHLIWCNSQGEDAQRGIRANDADAATSERKHG